MIFFAVFLCHIEPTCQKLRFYNQNCEFWPLGPLLSFLKGPTNSSKTKIFKKQKFILFYFVTLSLLTKYYVSAAFSPLGSHRATQGPFQRTPYTHQNLKKSNVIFFLIFLCHIEPSYQDIICPYVHNYAVWFLGPFLKIKGPLKGAEMQIFKNR